MTDCHYPKFPEVEQSSKKRCFGNGGKTKWHFLLIYSQSVLFDLYKSVL